MRTEEEIRDKICELRLEYLKMVNTVIKLPFENNENYYTKINTLRRERDSKAYQYNTMLWCLGEG